MSAAARAPRPLPTVRLLASLAVTGLLLGACSPAPPPAPPQAPAPEAAAAASAASGSDAGGAAAPAADAWLGQWTGPEGSFLRLTGGQGVYELTIQNLDGPSTYPARAAGAGIQFERQGVTESLRATNGAETGMKWLADKQDCLTVRAGEGYCRD